MNQMEHKAEAEKLLRAATHEPAMDRRVRARTIARANTHALLAQIPDAPKVLEPVTALNCESEVLTRELAEAQERIAALESQIEMHQARRDYWIKQTEQWSECAGKRGEQLKALGVAPWREDD